jgi:biopolymer transport protein ExbD
MQKRYLLFLKKINVYCFAILLIFMTGCSFSKEKNKQSEQSEQSEQPQPCKCTIIRVKKAQRVRLTSKGEQCLVTQCK